MIESDQELEISCDSASWFSQGRCDKGDITNFAEEGIMDHY